MQLNTIRTEKRASNANRNPRPTSTQHPYKTKLIEDFIIGLTSSLTTLVFTLINDYIILYQKSSRVVFLILDTFVAMTYLGVIWDNRLDAICEYELQLNKTSLI